MLADEHGHLFHLAQDFMRAVMVQQENPSFRERYIEYVRHTDIQEESLKLKTELIKLQYTLGNEHPQYVSRAIKVQIDLADSVASVCVQVCTPTEFKSLCAKDAAHESIADTFNKCGAKNLALVYTPWRNFQTNYATGKRVIKPV